MDSKNTESTVGQDDQQHHAVARALKMPEVLDMILQFLAEPPSKDLISAALVNREWRDAAYRPSLWKKHTATVVLQPLDTVQLLPSLAQRRISRIDLIGLQTHMRDLLPSLPSLQSLNLYLPQSQSDSVMTDEMLCGAFQKQHTALTTFNLVSCKKITDASVIQLSSRLPNLKDLGLCCCPLVTDAGLVAVARNLPLLENLYVNHTAITDAGVAALAGRRPEVAAGTPNLRTLNLSGCGITDTALLHVGVGLTKLVVLLLCECQLLTNAGLVHLVTPVDKGTLLNVAVLQSRGITKAGLKLLPKLKKPVYLYAA